MDHDSTLPTLAVKRLHQQVQFPFTAYCDVHDLLAIALEGGNIDVFRIANAQTAFSIKRKDDECNAIALHWKPDGSYLAVAWNDGTYVLYSGETGRLVSQANTRAEHEDDEWRLDLRPDFGPDDDESNVTNVSCFGWTVQDGRLTKDRATSKASPTTDDWFDRPNISSNTNDHPGTFAGPQADVHSLSVADLARSIAALDVTQVLPRLSAIPAHQMPFAKAGPGGNKFASQSATDNIFCSAKDVHSHLVQSLFVCQDDGNVQVLLDETVKIGACRVAGRPLLHLSSPQSAHHAILSENSASDVTFHSIDLPLSTLSGPLLYVVATNTKRIQNLLDYIAHAVRCIEHDFTTGQQLPGRLLNNLNESLAEKKEGTAVYNLYRLAMTGDFSPTMLEWLVDIVREPTQKRWDQAVGTMYTNIHNHVFMNLLPAIDRLSIAITTLRGHARLHEGSSTFDVPPALFTNMLDTADSMRLIAQKMQLVIMTEHKQFRTFIKWLRIFIEIGAAEPFSRSAAETEERELPSLDYSLLLAYIKDTMTQSKLSSYIQPRPEMSGSLTEEDFFKHPVISNISYQHTAAALKLLNNNKPLKLTDVSDAPSLLNLPSVTATLLAQTRVALQRITKWQSRMLPAPVSTALSTSSSAILDSAASTRSKVLVIRSPHPADSLTLQTVTVSTASPEPTFATLQLGLADDGDAQILDAKLDSLEPLSLLVLVRRAEGGALLLLLKYADTSAPTAPQRQSHSFPLDAAFRPERLLVGGRRGRRVCVVFGAGRREWRALALNHVHAQTASDLAGMKGKSANARGPDEGVDNDDDEDWEDADTMDVEARM